jgi:hypothetical protein
VDLKYQFHRPPTEQFPVFAVTGKKLAGTEEGPRTVTLERPLECGAHEEITNWQKDRGVCKRYFVCSLFYYWEYLDTGSIRQSGQV